MIESESPTIQNSMWALVRELGKFGGVVAFLGALASVVYDWGFFVALNLSFAEAPTILADHIHSWLIWLPRVSVAVLFITFISFFLRRVEQGMTEDEIIASSPRPYITRIFRASPYIFIALLGVYFVISWLLFGSKYTPIEFLLFGLIIVWFIFCRWVFSHPVVREHHSDLFVRLFFWIPPILILIFSWGYTSAPNDISRERTNYTISVNSSNSSSTKSSEIHLIRTFGEWILIDQNQERVSWVRLSEIVKLELIEEKRQFPGMVCVFFDNLCPDDLPLTHYEP